MNILGQNTMDKKHTNTKKKIESSSSGVDEQDIDSLDLKRTFSVLGAKVHDQFSRLPISLRITKKDAVEMYRQIDIDARIRSYPYWLFLIASCGIAILGLIINSPAVIIGAMLISPLMAPIIGLGMGVAINDIYLSMKSIVNIVLSLVVAVLTAALISYIVPLHSPTPEILARTNPTVLDLFIALFCGLVAALSSVRSGSHEVLKSVAPGAAIGVALMPPVCVIGFGMGNGFDIKMMWGSFLLFLTNLMAIVIVSSLFYYFIYNQYSVRKLLQVVSAKREKEETFYKGRFKPLWLTWNDFNSSGFKRFLFPSLLIILISYPLTSSLLFLKKKIEVSKTIESQLHQNIKNLQIIRGTGQLTFTNEAVNGNILYSSSEIPGPELLINIKNNIKGKYSDYNVELSLIRIADSSDLLKLQQKEELSLETSKNTMHDTIRHAYAADLVQRALDLLHPRFPEEVGILHKVEIAFATRGINTINIYYFAKRKLGNLANKQLSAVYKNELHSLQADVKKVNLVFDGPGFGTMECRAGQIPENQLNILDMQKKVGIVLLPLQENSHLRLKLGIRKTHWTLLQKNIPKNIQSRIEIKPPVNNKCILDYLYY